MVLNLSTMILAIPLGILIPLFLLWISLKIIKHTNSGRYWIATWIPVGWMASLSLVEWIAIKYGHYRETLAKYNQIPLTDWQTFHLLWTVAFALLLIGFLPYLRPSKRSARINLLLFSITWTVIMFFVNLYWIGFIIVISTIAPG